MIPPANDSDLARIREQRRTCREQAAAAAKLEPVCYGLGLDTAT
jgi:hypothetical protein